jgi:acyl-coenzyme A synthetase/AMP-(fatty) acid ligase
LTFLIEKKVRDRVFSITFYTSGSTGNSKKIVKTFESLAKETAMHIEMLKDVLESKPIILSTVDPTHMYGMLWRVMLPKYGSCEVDEEIILTPESLISKMNKAERVILVSTPSFLDRFTAYADQYKVPKVCVEIISSGSMLSREVSLRTKAVFGVAPREIFGSTETGGVAWRRQTEEVPEEKCLWQVFGPVTVKAKKDPDSQMDNIVVNSPFSFKRNYAMGDAVVFSDDKRSFRLMGRLNRLVKINEERVNLAEMEVLAAKALNVKECVLVKLTGGHGDILGCVIASDGDFERSSLELRKALLPIFPKGTVPKRFRIVKEIKRNHQGKIINEKIKEMF